MEKNLKIVVFGCDNTGKTTLCEGLQDCFLQNGYNAEIAKSIGANKTVEQYVDFMKKNLRKKHIVIFDRFPIIEEATCGRVLRNNDIFEEWQAEDISELIDEVDIFIMCYPGLFNTLNWGEREQMEGVKDNATKLIDAYNQMAVALLKLNCLVMEYNYTNKTPEDVFKILGGEK